MVTGSDLTESEKAVELAEAYRSSHPRRRLFFADVFPSKPVFVMPPLVYILAQQPASKAIQMAPMHSCLLSKNWQ